MKNTQMNHNYAGLELNRDFTYAVIDMENSGNNALSVEQFIPTLDAGNIIQCYVPVDDNPLYDESQEMYDIWREHDQYFAQNRLSGIIQNVTTIIQWLSIASVHATIK